MLISGKKLEAALQRMKLGKTSGLDGLPIEFYRAFKDELLTHFEGLLNYCHQKNITPGSCKEARVVLIQKEGKDFRYPSAYRPISILII